MTRITRSALSSLGCLLAVSGVLAEPPVVTQLLPAGGDFGASLLACVEDDSIDTQALDALNPAPGAALYYLVRAERACRSGTYDDGGAGQSDGRDGGVAAPPSRCP